MRLRFSNIINFVAAGANDLVQIASVDGRIAQTRTRVPLHTLSIKLFDSFWPQRIPLRGHLPVYQLLSICIAELYVQYQPWAPRSGLSHDASSRLARYCSRI